MEPTAVLEKSSTTHTKIKNATISNQSTFVSSTDLHYFGVYHFTTVGVSEVAIRTFVPIPINAPPYRKALIVKLFFRVDTSSVSVSNLISTVTTYFDMSTTIIEREVEVSAISIRDSIFCIDNMVGVDFLEFKGGSITINDPIRRSLFYLLLYH